MAAGLAALHLAIHSTAELVGVALTRDGELLGERHLDGGRTAIRLPAAIEALLADAGTIARDIGRIAVAVGPGSFTGIKVGLSIAYGLARATGAGVVGVDSLEVLAAQAPRDAAAATLLPAGRGELYLAVFASVAGDARRPVLLAPRLTTLREAREHVEHRIAVALACDTLVDGLGAVRLIAADGRLLARSLAELARARAPLPAGRLPDPLYLRRTWAEESLAARSLSRPEGS